ncbi:MAG: rod shape-determining protein MreD [Eggerthellaceae bacterium]
MINRESLPVLIGALIAVVAQVVIAPNIALFSAMPNFLVAYVLVVAMLRPTDALYAMAFVLGLISDLLGFGPVGAMPFLLIIASFAVSRAFLALDNGTAFMPLLIFIVAAFSVEIFYAAFLIGLGIASSPLDAFMYRALPCALYDCVCGLLLYPLGQRFLARKPLANGASHPSHFR